MAAFVVRQVVSSMKNEQQSQNLLLKVDQRYRNCIAHDRNRLAGDKEEIASWGLFRDLNGPFVISFKNEHNL